MGVNMALERRFQEPLAVTLAMEWRFQGLLAVKLALERQFRGCLGAWRDSKGATGCRKERSKASEWTPRARKSMPSGPWTPKKTNFVTQLSRELVSECFSIDFWHFCKVGEASEVPRLSAKTKVWPFALWVALEPRKIMKIRRFQWPLDVRLAPEWRFQEPLDVKLGSRTTASGALGRQVGPGWVRGPVRSGFRDRF